METCRYEQRVGAYLGHYLGNGTWSIVYAFPLFTSQASLDQSELQTAGVSDDQHLAVADPSCTRGSVSSPNAARAALAHCASLLAGATGASHDSGVSGRAWCSAAQYRTRAPISHSHRTAAMRQAPLLTDGACVLVSPRGFQTETTAYLCLGQFRYFNRSRVEIFLYASTSDPSRTPRWRRLPGNVDHFREAHRDHGGGAIMSSAAASAMVAADHLDILVDLDGYSNEVYDDQSSSQCGTLLSHSMVRLHVCLGNPEVEHR